MTLQTVHICIILLPTKYFSTSLAGENRLTCLHPALAGTHMLLVVAVIVHSRTP